MRDAPRTGPSKSTGSGGPVRAAIAALAVVAILFLFVFPTRSYLAQRGAVNDARHDVARAAGAERQARAGSGSACRRRARSSGSPASSSTWCTRASRCTTSVTPAPDDHDDDHDRSLSERSRRLGRRAGHRVRRRCAHRPARPRAARPRSRSSSATRTGEPVVIRNAPLLDDGTPMPTRYWLVDPRARGCSVSRLESAGGVRAAEAAVDRRRAAGRARALRGRARRRAPGDHDGPAPAGGVGGTRTRREVPARALRLFISPAATIRSGAGSRPRLADEETARMTRVAAVDIGTNSTRLLVADVDGPTARRGSSTVERRTRITRLGQGVDTRRAGSTPTRSSARVAVLREYREVIDAARRRARAHDRDERVARRDQPRRVLRPGRGSCSACGPS